jgi:hypothetical protein
LKEKANIAGGLFSIGFTVTFAVYLANNNVPQNIASWTMWALLDAFVLVTCIAAGNKKPWLPLGYTLGAFLVTCILFSKSGWKWGTVETVSAVGVLVALLSWWKLGPKTAIVAIVVAMLISSIPAVCDAWCQNGQNGWWYWAGISFCCILSSYGAKAWTIEDRLFPVSSFVFSSGMATVLLL